MTCTVLVVMCGFWVVMRRIYNSFVPKTNFQCCRHSPADCPTTNKVRSLVKPHSALKC